MKGRILARNTIRRSETLLGTIWSNELGVDSARIGVEFKDRVHDLEIEVEAELTERDASVRDAYLRLEPTRRIRVQAGRFKRPISAIALESRWDLPIVERGALNDYELYNENTDEPDELPLGGRATGVQVQLRDKKLDLEPELTVGVFRSVVHGQLEEAVGTGRRPLELSEHPFPEDIFSRLEIEPMSGMKAAASFAWVGQLDGAGDADTFRHGFVTGLDVVLERGPLRLWAEGFLGTSPFHLSNDLQAQGRFLAARTIVSARLPVRSLYVEPYVTGQRLDVSSELDEDVILQGGGGVNLGLGEMWKLQLAVDHLSMGNRLYGAGTLFYTQLGAVF